MQAGSWFVARVDVVLGAITRRKFELMRKL